MRKAFLAVLLAFAGLAATPAMGCRIWMPSAAVSVIHSELPSSLPPGAMAFDVQFEEPEGSWEALFRGTRARVRRVVRGDYAGAVVIVRDRADGVRITCYNPIRPGSGAGLVVGIPTGYENGVLVLQPIFEPHESLRRGRAAS
jgi:hypothetical protein